MKKSSLIDIWFHPPSYIMAKRARCKNADSMSDTLLDERPCKQSRLAESSSSIRESNPDGMIWLKIGKLYLKLFRSPHKDKAIMVAKKAVAFRPMPGPGGALVFYGDGSRDEAGQHSSMSLPVGGFGLVHTFPCVATPAGGTVLRYRVYRIDHCVSSVHSELAAIIEALSIASDFVEQRSWYWMRVKVFSDCLPALDLIRKSMTDPKYFQKPKHPSLLPAIETLERVADSLADYGSKVELHWVPRKSFLEMYTVDRLAGEAWKGDLFRELSARTTATRNMDLEISQLHRQLAATNSVSKQRPDANKQ